MKGREARNRNEEEKILNQLLEKLDFKLKKLLSLELGIYFNFCTFLLYIGGLCVYNKFRQLLLLVRKGNAILNEKKGMKMMIVFILNTAEELSFSPHISRAQ